MNLALFRAPNFARYVAAAAATVFGTAFLQTALSLYMLDLTGSAGKFGLSLMIGQIPNLLVGLFAGAIVDRLDRRQVMERLAWLRAVLLFALVLYGVVGPVTEGMIYGLTALLGLCQTLAGPAEVAMLPAIVSREDLVDANALHGTLVESLLVAGPVLSATLYSATGLRFTVVLCAALFAVAGVALALLNVAPEQHPAQARSILVDIGSGFGLFRRELRLASLVFNGFLSHLFLFPLFLVGFPFIIKQLFHGSNLDVGIVESAATVGSISSVLLVAALRKRVSVSQGILLGIIGMIAAVVPMAALASTALVSALAGQQLYMVAFFGALSVVMFWMFGAYGVFYVTFYQRTVPADMLGRFYAIQALAFGLARMLGFQMYGYLLDHHALTVSVAVLGAGMLAKLLVHIPFMRLDAVLTRCDSSLPVAGRT